MKNKLIILIIVLIAIGVGAFIYLSSSSVSDGLTTYTNEELGFSFQYPEDWDLTEYSESGLVVSLQSPEVIEGIENGRGFIVGYDFKVSYWSDVNNSGAQAGYGPDSRYDYKNLEEFLNDPIDKMVNKTGDTEISGIPAHEVNISGHFGEKAIMFELNGLYSITYTSRAESVLLLKTFKILE